MDSLLLNLAWGGLGALLGIAFVFGFSSGHK